MPTRHDLDETPSTHALAVAAACDGAPHGEAWTALAQTAGRGRLGRGWRSPSGLHNIYLSVVVRPPWTTRDLPQTPLLAGVCAALTLLDLTPLTHPTLALKWPNDLLCHRRKLGGILCEATSSPSTSTPLPAAVIVSVGLNLNSDPDPDFPPDLRPFVTSLTDAASLSGLPLRADASLRASLIRGFLDRLLAATSAPLLLPDLHHQWRLLSCLPSRVRLPDGREGDATHLDPSGALCVCLDHGGAYTVHSADLYWPSLSAQYRPDLPPPSP